MMEIDIQIKNATLEDLRNLFSKENKGLDSVRTVIAASPISIGQLVGFGEDHREENLARSIIPGDELKDLGPGVAPVEISSKDLKVQEPGKKKKPKGKRGGNHSKGNKYGIPSDLWRTDKSRYQTLWSRCKKHGITYEEAIKRDGMKGGGRPPITKTFIKSTKLVVAASEKSILPQEIKIGDHVKQIKKFHDRQVSSIGIVSAIKNGLVEVNFSGTQFYKIAPDCLEVV